MVFERLSAELTLDSSGFKRGVENAKSSMQDLGDRTRRVGKGMQSAGKSMSMGVTAPLGAMAVGSAKAAADFESNMTESLAIMGDVGKGLEEEMAQKARTMAKETTFSADQAAQSYYYLASAGLDAQESMDQMGNVAKFAQAGMFDMAEATDILTDANSALGRETGEMANLSDQLVKANQQANASVEQFGKALTKKGAAAMKRLGVESEEGIAILSAFADQGLKGERAGTILARSLGGLEKTARKNSDALEEMGVQVMNSKGELRPMHKVIKDLEKATAGMSTEQRNAALEQLGLNARAQRGIDMMMGNSDAIKEYKKNLENAQGATDEVANKQLKSLNAQLSLLKSQVMDVGITIGNDFAPHLKTIVQHAQEATKKFSNLSERQRKMVVAVSAVLAAIGPLLFALGTFVTLAGSAISGVGTLVGALTGVASAFGLASSGVLLLLGPIGLVIAAVAALAYGIKTDFAGMGEAASNVASKFTYHFNRVRREFNDTASAVKKALGPEVESAVSRARSAVESLLAKIEPPLAKVVNIVEEKLVLGMHNAADAIIFVLEVIEDAAQNGFQWGPYISRALGYITKVKSVLTGFVAWVQSKIPSVSIPFQMFTGVVQSVKSTVVSAFGVVKEQLNGVRIAVAKFAAKAKGALPTVTIPVNRISGAFQTLQTTVASVVAVVRSSIGAFAATVKSKINAVVGTVTAKLPSAASSANTLSSAFDGVKSAAKTASKVAGKKLGKLKNAIKATNIPASELSTISLVLGKRLLGVAGPLGIVTTAVLALRSEFEISFKQIKGTVLTGWQTITATFQKHGGKIIGTARKTLGLIVTIFRKQLLPIVLLVTRIFQQISTIIGETLAFVIKTVVPTFLQNLQSLWQRHMGKLVNEALMTFNAILRVVNRVLALVKQVIAAVLYAINEIWRRWGSEIKMFVAGVFDFIRVIIVTVLDGILVLIRTVLALIRGDWNMAWDLIASYLQRTLGRVLSYAREWGPRFIGWLKVFLNQAWDKFLTFGDWLLFTFIPNLFATILSTARTEGPKFINWLKNWLNTAVDKFVTFGKWLLTTFLPNLFNTIVSVAEEHGPDVLAFFEDLITGIGNALVDLTMWVKDTFVPELFRTFRSAIEDNGPKAVNAVLDVRKKLIDKITGLIDPFRNAGKDAMDALKEGIESKIGAVKGAAGSAASGIRDKLPGSDAKEGPLSDLTDSADAIPSTLIDKIERGTRGVNDAASTLASAAEPEPELDPSVQTGTNSRSGRLSRELRQMRKALEDMDAEISEAEVEVTDDGLLRFVDGRIAFKKERDSIKAFSRNNRTN